MSLRCLSAQRVVGLRWVTTGIQVPLVVPLRFPPPPPPTLPPASQKPVNIPSAIHSSLIHTACKFMSIDFCEICQCSVPQGNWDAHVIGRSHCRKVGWRYEDALQSVHQDRNGVSVSTKDSDCTLDFGVIDPGIVSQAVKTIKIMTGTEEFMLLDPKWTSSSLSIGTESECVIPPQYRPPPDWLSLSTASRVKSKAILTLREIATFGSMYACAPSISVDMKTCWRSNLSVYPTMKSSS